MCEVKLIEKINGKIDRKSGNKIVGKLRVGAYCRVSTDNEDQLNSYASQLSYYKEKIANNIEWSLVDIYADEAISGTLDYKRSDFLRMINDATSGKLDLIMTKSISRFARNTLDTLKYVRLLKQHNVAILFEEENINTLEMSGELLLTILSSVAQQESETISSHVKLGLKMKMQRGELIGFNGCLGYDYNPIDKSIYINETEAEIVRFIFERYRDGLGSQMISKELEKHGYKTKAGSSKWHDSTIRGILKNEKYKGDILMGKSFTVDPISHRRLTNMGEEDRYYISNHHEPIISEELWNEVQNEFERRSIKHGRGNRLGKYSSKYTFSDKLVCGFCGKAVTRRRRYTQNSSKNVWHCSSYIKHGKASCANAKAIAEETIEKCFLTMYQKLSYNNEAIIEVFLKRVEESINECKFDMSGENITQAILRLESKRDKIVDMKIDGTIEEDVYKVKYAEFENKIKELNRKLESLVMINQEKDEIKRRIVEFRRLLERKEPVTEFDENIFKCLIDRVIVGEVDEDGNANPYVLNFVFKSGEKVKCIDENGVKKNEINSSFVSSDTRRNRRVTFEALYHQTCQLGT